MSKLSILYVDDEVNVLKSFTSLVRKEDYDVLTASCPDEAVKIFEENENIAVVLSDMRMPRPDGKDSKRAGVELLKKVQELRPTVVRILTTAFSDMESAIDAVNQGYIYKYIKKPWDDHEDLKITLRNAVNYYKLKQQKNDLLKEKLHSKHRAMLSDRIRNLTMISASLYNRFKNPISALKAFVDLCPLKTRLEEYDDDYLNLPAEDIWNKNIKDNLKLVKTLGDSLENFNDVYFKDQKKELEIFIEELVSHSVDFCQEQTVGHVDLSYNLAIPNERYKIRTQNSLMIQKLFQLILMRMIKPITDNVLPKGTIDISAENSVRKNKGNGVSVFITYKSNWTEESMKAFFAQYFVESGLIVERGMDLLLAFFMLYDQDGELTIHKDVNEGPKFEIFIPILPGVFEDNKDEECQVIDSLFRKYEDEDLLVGSNN